MSPVERNKVDAADAGPGGGPDDGGGGGGVSALGSLIAIFLPTASNVWRILLRAPTQSAATFCALSAHSTTTTTTTISFHAMPGETSRVRRARDVSDTVQVVQLGCSEVNCLAVTPSVLDSRRRLRERGKERCIQPTRPADADGRAESVGGWHCHT